MFSAGPTLLNRSPINTTWKTPASFRHKKPAKLSNYYSTVHNSNRSYMIVIMSKILLLTLMFIITSHLHCPRNLSVKANEMDADRLWLFDDTKSSNNPNNLYVLNENSNNNNYITNSSNHQHNETLPADSDDDETQIEDTLIEPQHSTSSSSSSQLPQSSSNSSSNQPATGDTDCDDQDCVRNMQNRQVHKRQGSSVSDPRVGSSPQEDYEASASTFRVTLATNSSSSMDSRSDSDNQLSSAPDRKNQANNGNSNSNNNNNNQKSQDNNNNNKGSAKKPNGRLNFFKSPSKKISLTSLLPKSKRQDSSNAQKPPGNNNNNNNNNSNNNKNQFMTTGPRGFAHSQTPPLHHMYPYSSSHLLFGATLPGFSNHHNHFFNFPRPDEMLGHQSIQSQTTIAQPSYHHPASQALVDHHYAPQMEFSKPADFAPIFYHPIAGGGPNRSGQLLGKPPNNNHQNSNNSGNGNGNGNKNNKNNNGNNNNGNSNNQNNNNNKTNQTRNESSSSSGQHSTALPIGAAAAALISERAKSFISQLNRGGSSNSNSKSPSSGQRNNRDTANNSNTNNNNNSGNSNTGTGNMMKSASDQVGLASYIKNAADAWAASNPGAEVTPSIIVEHDGPTITTVDFGAASSMGAAQGPPPHAPRIIDAGGGGGGDEPEDEEVSTFFEDEHEEHETGGSHDAKRISKLRHPMPGHLQSQQHYHPHHHPHPRHPHPHHAHHHSYRHPFDQPAVQSHAVQTELAMADAFYNMDPMDNSPYNARAKKMMGMGPPMGHPHHPDFMAANYDYMNSLQKHNMDPQNHFQANGQYPDSINAMIKAEGGSHGDAPGASTGAHGNKVSDLAATITNKLSNSNNDQIEQLIRELQELNKRKRQQEAEAGDGSSNNKKSLKASASSDYEDLIGGKDEEEEDERIRLLRKKLLARLRSKQERGGGGKRQRGLYTASGSNFHNEAIKIPLHALLLAALDRRMSPSEQNQPSVVPGEGEQATGKQLQQVNKSTSNSNHQRHQQQQQQQQQLERDKQQDYNEVTSGSANFYHDQLSGVATTQSPSQLVAAGQDDPSNATIMFRESFAFDREPPPNHHQHHHHHHHHDPSPEVTVDQQHLPDASLTNEYSGPSVFLTLNSGGRFAADQHDQFNGLQRGNESSSSLAVIDGDFSMMGENRSALPYNETSFQGLPGATSTGDELTEAQFYSATTRMPSMVQARLARGNFLQQHPNGGHHHNHQSELGSSDGLMGVDGHRAEPNTKRRRDLEGLQGRGDGPGSSGSGSGDFDVGRQVEEFSRDHSEPSFEPSEEWAVRRVKQQQQQQQQVPRHAAASVGVAMKHKRGPNSVHFDDDFEEMAKLTRHKILKRRRKPPQRPDDGASGDGDDEGGEDGSSAAESNFFNKIQRDTSDPEASVDKTIAQIESSSARLGHGEEPHPATGSSVPGTNRRPRRVPDNDSDDDESDEDTSGADGQDGPEDGAGEFSAESRQQQQQPQRRKATDPKWRPQMIDDEVQKMENIARLRARQEEAKGEGSSSSSKPYSEPQSDYQETSGETGEPKGLAEPEEASTTAESCDTSTTMQPSVNGVASSSASVAGFKSGVVAPAETRRITAVASTPAGRGNGYPDRALTSMMMRQQPPMLVPVLNGIKM